MPSAPKAKVRLPAEPIVEGSTALRPWREGDIPAIVEACQDPEIPRWTRVPHDYGESDARAYMLSRYDAILNATGAPFAIVSATDLEELLGSISLFRFSWPNLRGEVGYWLARPARGHGHATRAVRAICRWGFDTLGLGRIDLLAATGNPASQHVAERCGFTREAVLRSYMSVKDGRQDMVAFGLLRGEVE
ncbi:MAG: GNAT family N-acetyltransferase [Solirubrobacteraceae bacterium]